MKFHVYQVEDGRRLPTDGLRVEEFSGADDERLFLLAWRQRVQQERAKRRLDRRNEPVATQQRT